MKTLPVLLTSALLVAHTATANDDLFEQQIAPLLEQHCLSCHDSQRQKGGLALDAHVAALRGGESGPVIVPGKPDESELVRMIGGPQPQMPKKGTPLSSDQVEAVRRWIANGAAWPEGRVLRSQPAADPLDWWSLKPLQRPALPTISETGAAWARTPIDALIVARLDAMSLQPSQEATRRTLIRRLYFDLVGLPPAWHEVESFAADTNPDAYERLVDRLLASPHYGQRWARHWLDVVHYGDTHGYDKDKVRLHAWPYRDYVIRAFNSDKPYGRFVREQLAGDLLWPHSPDGIVALGFIAAGPWDYVGHVELREGTVDKQITRNLDRDDMVTATMNTFVSLTAQCARCHDHKFDPVTQEDYYGIQAVFAAVDRADRPYVAASTAGDQAAAAQSLVYAAATDFSPEGSFRPTNGSPRPVPILARGEIQSPGPLALPGAVEAIDWLESRFQLTDDHTESERRLALANWIVDKQNPLTWRSIANRIWQYHFGAGLVDSPNDFGRMGLPPSHPDLLDWLAVQLRDNGQSLKRLHRLILTSAAYRQSSSVRPECLAADRDNRLLWRFNRRRLDAESTRDAVLAASGKLDQKMSGPPFRPFGFKDDHSPHYLYENYDPNDPATHRRSVYRLIVRSVPDPLMETLDCADPSQSVPKRNETITPLQALTLMNNKLVVAMAEHFGSRVERLGDDLPSQITAACRIALSRDPAAEELLLLETLARRHGLANVCRMLFNTNEFVYVD